MKDTDGITTIINQIISTGRSERDNVILRLIAGAGLKTGELIALRIQDIDVKGSRLRKIGYDHTVYIPLDNLTLYSIRQYIQNERPSGTKYENLLLTRNGNPITQVELFRVVDRARRKVMMDFNGNTLRYMALGVWYESGVDLETVLQRAGYSRHRNNEYRFKERMQNVFEQIGIIDLANKGGVGAIC